MELEFRRLKTKDIKQVIKYADVGMHFYYYCENKLLRYLYGKYYFLSALKESTRVIALYHGDDLAGVLLANIRGEEKTSITTGQKIFIKFCDWATSATTDFEVEYTTANLEMLTALKAEVQLDGEINFLVANPKLLGHGIGSRLLDELRRQEHGKTLYVYTDDKCSYPFYDHTGFTKKGEKDIRIDLGKKIIPLKCFLYCQTF